MLMRDYDMAKNEASNKLSEEDDKLKKILLFMKNTIKESNLPWVSWKLLENNAEKILGSSRRPEADLWAIHRCSVKGVILNPQ